MKTSATPSQECRESAVIEPVGLPELNPHPVSRGSLLKNLFRALVCLDLIFDK